MTEKLEKMKPNQRKGFSFFKKLLGKKETAENDELNGWLHLSEKEIDEADDNQIQYPQ